MTSTDMDKLNHGERVKTVSPLILHVYNDIGIETFKITYRTYIKLLTTLYNLLCISYENASHDNIYGWNCTLNFS
jgi:hypothetical protein